MNRSARLALVSVVLAAGTWALAPAVAVPDEGPPEVEAPLARLRNIEATSGGALVIIKPDDARVTTFVTAVHAVAREGNPRAISWLIDRLDDKLENVYADHLVHFGIRQGLVWVPQGSKGDLELKKRLKSDRSWTKQLALAWTQRKRPADPEVDAILRGWVKNPPKPQLQFAAIKALGERRVVAAVDDLIEVLSKHEAEKDRLWYDARLALWAATGYDRATGVEWRSLWVGKAKRFDPEKDRGTDARFTPALGTTVPSLRVIVAIDTSGSLHIRDPIPGTAIPRPNPNLPAKKCGDCGQDHGPGTADAPWERQRIERGKEACGKILRALRPKARFNLVRFDSKTLTWGTRGTLLPVTAHDIESARDYLQPIKAAGTTRMLHSLELAFACDDLELLYVLTDGAPTSDDTPNSDDGVAIDEVIARARILNRFREVRIFGVGFKQCRSALLEVLAREHGGTVTYLE